MRIDFRSTIEGETRGRVRRRWRGLSKDGKGILQIAVDHGITVNPLISTLSQDGCKPGQLPPEKGWAIIDAASSAVLEETLTCSTTAAAQLTELKAKYADVAEYREEL